MHDGIDIYFRKFVLLSYFHVFSASYVTRLRMKINLFFMQNSQKSLFILIIIQILWNINIICTFISSLLFSSCPEYRPHVNFKMLSYDATKNCKTKYQDHFYYVIRNKMYILLLSCQITRWPSFNLYVKLQKLPKGNIY